MNPYTHPHAADYARETRRLDLAPLRERFLDAVRARRDTDPLHLLDVGCGAGRDVRAFLDAGCRVEAFDASRDMAELAESYAGVPVGVLRVQELERERAFDGIWACASLLHVPWDELPDVFGRLERALRPGGVLYASFRFGAREYTEGERRFTDVDMARLYVSADAGSGLHLFDAWLTPDPRPERHATEWMNGLFQREAPGA